jgi:Protein of unknown function (DUF732)
MPSPRWLTRLTIPMVAGAALVSSSAIAAADPSDDAYFAKLAAVGLTWPPDHAPSVISLGHHICFDRTQLNFSPDQIAQDIHPTMDQQGFSFANVTSIVNAAEAAYCPS